MTATTLPAAVNVMRFLERFEDATLHSTEDIYFVGTDDMGPVALTIADLRGVLDYAFSLEETMRGMVGEVCWAHSIPSSTCTTCQALSLLKRGELIEPEETSL